MPDAAPEPPAGRSFEDMLADPGEQFDPRSELLASIAAYAAAPSGTPSATPPRPLTAPGVVAGLLADVADARAQLADVQHGAGAWIREAVARETAGLTARLAETLAANQRWAETLADVRQRHAEVKRERDAHKLRADHYEGLWRKEHGLSPDDSASGQEMAGEYPPVPVPAAAWVTLDELAAAIGRSMPRIRSDIERADGWIAARVEDPRDYAWGLLQQCAGWDPDAEMPSAGRDAP